MRWKWTTAGNTKINRAVTRPRHDLEHYCRDLNGWPRSWMGLEKDLPPGEQLLTLFRPFLEYLAASDLSGANCATATGPMGNRLANTCGMCARLCQRA